MPEEGCEDYQVPWNWRIGERYLPGPLARLSSRLPWKYEPSL